MQINIFVLKFFKMTNLEDLAQKKSYSDEEFSFIVERSHQLTDEKEAEWSLKRLKRKVKCSSCEDFVLSLTNYYLIRPFHPLSPFTPRDEGKACRPPSLRHGERRWEP